LAPAEFAVGIRLFESRYGRFPLIFVPLLAVMISALFYVIVQEHNNN
jgi:hypothetical protein